MLPIQIDFRVWGLARCLVSSLESAAVQSKIAELVCQPLLEASNVAFGRAVGTKVGEMLAKWRADMRAEIDSSSSQRHFEYHGEATVSTEARIGSSRTQRRNRQRKTKHSLLSYTREHLLLVKSEEMADMGKTVLRIPASTRDLNKRCETTDTVASEVQAAASLEQRIQNLEVLTVTTILPAASYMAIHLS